MKNQQRINREIVLNSRPAGIPTADNFRLQRTPVADIEPGSVLLRNQFLSLDPYMRGRMNDGPSYATPIEIGQVMGGGTVSKVELSEHQDFKVGDLVVTYGGWQDYCISDGSGLRKIGPEIIPSSLALGVLGMTGFTAYAGLLNIGEPKAGETVVVAAATGAVGSVVAQIARLKGCRVVGIAGGAKKCLYATDELGMAVCLDHHDPDLAQRLQKACPSGIDIYFENVGGAIFEAVLPLLNIHARIPLCGLIATYNKVAGAEGFVPTADILRTILTKRLRMEGFIISDYYGTLYNQFSADMTQWLKDGAIKDREDWVDGLENAPAAFIGMLDGKNFGKLIVNIVEEDPPLQGDR